MQNEPITIPKHEWDDLIRESVLLRCLAIAGVSEWEGFDGAVEAYDEAFNDEEKVV